MQSRTPQNSKVKEQEEKENREFTPILAKLRAEVATVENEANIVAASAAPLIAMPPEEGDALTKELEKIEAAAEAGQKKMAEVRNELVAKLAVARKYTGEAKAGAVKEVMQLQGKLSEVQRKLGPFKAFKKEFAACAAAQKAAAEIADKLGEVAPKIEKASDLCKSAGSTNLSEGDLAAVDDLIGPASKKLTEAMQTIARQARAADPATASKLDELKKRISALRAKLEGLNTKLKASRQEVALQKSIISGREKVAAVEEQLKKCQEAEMPFLKGIEVLPKDESAEAIGASEASGSEALRLVKQAMQFLQTNLASAKRLPMEQQDSMKDQLNPLLKRVQTAEVKINDFRKETAERKLNALLAEAVDAVALVEKKAGSLEGMAKKASIEKLEDSSDEEIREAIEQCRALEKDALAACGEARTVVAAKQREAAKGGNGGAQMKKIQDRLSVATAKVSKQQQAASSAERFLKTKAVLKQEEENMAQAEASVDKMEQSAPTVAGAEMSLEAVKTMDEAMASALKVLRATPGIIQPLMNTAPAKSKAALKAILERKSKAQEKIDKIKSGTKESRDKALSQFFLKEAAEKAAAVDGAIERTGEVELPYLKGIEVLPLQEALDTIAASEEATTVAQDAISKCKQYVNSKSQEARGFGEAEKRVVTEGFAKITGQLNEATQKLGAFNKETAARKKATQIQEAGAKVTEVEAEVKKVAAAAEPFEKEDAKDMSEEAAAGPLKLFLEAENAAKAKLNVTRNFLNERQRVSRDNADHMETVKKLLARMTNAQAEMAKAKKATAEHEGRFLARRLATDAADQVGTLDAEVKRATDACAPLLEQGGEEFLVATSVKVLATALAAHMKEKELDAAALYKAALAGEKKFTEGLFSKYVAGLAESIGREEVNFPEERRRAVFHRIDADKDGAISFQEFEAIFRQRGVVRKSLSLTDGFVVADSKTLCKAEPGDEVETFGVAKEDAGHMLRSECTLLKDGTKCWITLKGNAGAVFVDFTNPFTTFCADLDKAISLAESNVNRVSTTLSKKIQEGGTAPSGPLKDARDEMAKLRPKIADATASLKALRTKLVAGKAAFRTKEKSELNAHIEARERKEAAEITDAATPKVDAAEAATKAVEAAGGPFATLATDDEARNFATPAAVSASVEKLMTIAVEKTSEARAAVKEQLAVAQKISPPTGASTAARSQLQKMQAQLEQNLRAAKRVQGAVKAKCDGIVSNIYEETSKALREDAQKQGADVEKLFADLAKGEQKISEASFCAKVQALDNLAVQPEHAKLLCRRLESGGVSQRRFLGFVQLFYSVIKDIALTDVFDVGSCKTLRKAEKGEILEVLEGPAGDESLGLTRVRARSITDGVTGWITLRGNQGTPFLQDVEKPFYACRRALELAKDFGRAGVDCVRKLKEDEVLELVEGPRQEAFPDIVRARVKATKDGAQGWVTLRDRNEAALAEPNASLYICKTTVAMTDSEDIRSSKVVRKLAVEEFFDVTGELKEDTEAGIVRAQGKALKDGKLGWITTKGNAGTVFAEPASKYYSVLKPVELQRRFASEGAETVRALEVGETFQVLEGPRDEKVPPESFIKVRALADKAVGWVTRRTDAVKKWTPIYRCVVPTPIQDTRGAAEVTKTLRELAKGEQFELVEGPVEEGNGVRMMGVAKRDGVTGWVTIRGEDGKRHLDC